MEVKKKYLKLLWIPVVFVLVGMIRREVKEYLYEKKKVELEAQLIPGLPPTCTQAFITHGIEYINIYCLPHQGFFISEREVLRQKLMLYGHQWSQANPKEERKIWIKFTDEETPGSGKK